MQQGRVWNLAELMSLQNDRLEASAVSAGPENFEFFKQIHYMPAKLRYVKSQQMSQDFRSEGLQAQTIPWGNRRQFHLAIIGTRLFGLALGEIELREEAKGTRMESLAALHMSSKKFAQGHHFSILRW